MKTLVFILLLVVRCGVAVGQIRKYIFFTTPLSWNDAQKYCRKNYRDLATITSLEEYNQLLQSGSNSSGSWTGLSRTSGIWTWSDGEPLSFPNWFGDLTFLLPTQYSCAVTSSNPPGISANYRCDKIRNFFCYHFMTPPQEKMTWYEAQEYCRTYYTGLVSVTSDASLQQLKLQTAQMQMEAESVWTGLHFMDGRWFWVSGENLGSLVLMPSCPAPSHRCGSLNTMTKALENRNCDDRLNFVCY